MVLHVVATFPVKRTLNFLGKLAISTHEKKSTKKNSQVVGTRRHPLAGDNSEQHNSNWQSREHSPAAGDNSAVATVSNTLAIGTAQESGVLVRVTAESGIGVDILFLMHTDVTVALEFG